MAGALNKVIEQVAFKQVEEMIVYLELLSEQIISTSKTAKASQISFSSPSKSNDEMNKKLLESQRIIKQLQSDYKKQEEQIRKLSEATIKHTNAVNKLTQDQRNEIINNREIRKELDGNAVATSNLTTYIQKLSVERLKASRTVADYNAQIAIGNSLTEEQSQELATATASFQKYDNAIKAGKKSIGDAREYVGQYERANTGLSNSINQIARELPAATFGFQTFALGISNNVPIAVDEIKNAIAANKELIAQGKPTVSVWKQVGSALLSFNSIMSVGLLLLALYGKEISTFTKNLFGMNEALEEANKRQKDFNNARVEGRKDAQTDIIELRKYLSVVKDRTLSDELRQIALKKLRADYPYYFKNLTDEQILLGKTSDAEKQLTIDLEKRKEVEKKTSLNVENKQRLIDLEKELKANDKLQKSKEANARALSEIPGLNPSTLSKAYEELNNVQLKGNSIQQEINAIQGNTIKNDESIFNLKKETIALEYQEDKEKKEKIKLIKENTKANEDYLASEYELLHLRLTNVKNANEEVMNDEASNYDLRLQASEQYYNNLVDLANMEAKEELRVLKFSTEDRNRTVEAEYSNQKAQLDKYLKEQSITQSEYDSKLKEYQKQMQYDLNGIKSDSYNRELIIFENQAQKLVEANREVIDKMTKEWNEINFLKADTIISEAELENFQELGLLLGDLGSEIQPEVLQAKLNQISKIAQQNNDEITRSNLQRDLDSMKSEKSRIEEMIKNNGIQKGYTDEQIESQKKNNKTLLELGNQIIEKESQIQDADNKTKETELRNQQERLQTEKDINSQIFESRSNLYSEIGNLANQLFENKINDYDREIEKSNEYYDALIENAEDGSEQEKLLQERKQKDEEELQKKKIALQRKQALFNKAMAIAEIGIELYKAISAIQLQASILLSNPVTAALASLALSQIPIAIGTSAVQIAAVLATPLPQYKQGRIGGPEEMAITGDGGVNEIIEKPDGSLFVTPNKPTLTHLGKGDTVHSSFDAFNKSKLDLENASIMASFANQRMQLQAFDLHLSREFSGISEKIEKGIEKGFKKAKIINNNNMPKLDISHLNYKSKGFNA